MNCRIGKHNKINKKYENIACHCPLIGGKDICLWCCLHIADISDPSKRQERLDSNPDFISVPEDLKMPWDDIRKVCVGCSQR
jgi:hypothetical protein